jgi:hypothetical protein
MGHNYSGIYSDCRNILHDFLELKYSAGKKVHDEIISTVLAAEKVSEYYIDPVDAIVCNRTLILIAEGVFDRIHSVYLLDGVTKRYKTLKLRNATRKKLYPVVSE